jgi:hypothetical protein
VEGSLLSYPEFGGIDNLDREVDEFEEQMRRAMYVVQDHRYLFAARELMRRQGTDLHL